MITFQRVSHNRLYEQVLEQIEQFIDQGKLRPGDHLPPERELAAQLVVSRGTLREAFRVLENQGIIESRAGGGRYIRSLPSGTGDTGSDIIANLRRAAIMDLLEARETIELRIIELACSRATQENLDLVETALAQMKEAAASDIETIGLDQMFHLAIAKATHNVVFENIAKLYLDLLRETRVRTLQDPKRLTEMYQEHSSIFEALKSRDPELAKEVMARHLHRIKHAMDSAGVDTGKR